MLDSGLLWPSTSPTSPAMRGPKPIRWVEFEQYMAFSEQEVLVKEAREIMKPNLPQLSLLFFTTILEIAPAVKNMFSFLKDSEEIPKNNPKLKAHAVKTCESAIQLREMGKVIVADTTLRYMRSVHLKKGILDPHFEVVKEALLRTVQEAVGDDM